MWSRLLRALTALLNAYSFYSNPTKFVLSILTLILIPYLAYIFLGGIVFALLLVLGGYLIYRGIKSSGARSNSYKVK